ncbi:MAG: T9SS type A sorting domain-containing protein, partial [Salinivirgaceae bacterium]|nr:T9SS type A sorting domain-containing protein [Salinivirgaceae bacterium]
FNIYPNPSNGVFNVDVDGNATVTVMNVAGQVVDSKTINGSQTITLDKVNAGVYFVRVQVGENVGTKQLIIR